MTWDRKKKTYISGKDSFNATLSSINNGNLYFMSPLVQNTLISLNDHIQFPEIANWIEKNVKVEV